jgi:NTE family protein
MSKTQGRSAAQIKSVNLALQGGGSHGAFTWGVLDRLFEDGRIWIDAISGTSAGALNMVVAAQGMYDGGGAGARAELERFWQAVSRSGQSSPIARSPLDRLTGNWSLDTSPGYLWMDLISRLASPYDLNPLNYNPLRDLVRDFVDFKKVQDCVDMPIFVSATDVESGRTRVFSREEVTLDAVMASACLPFLFQAVEIDGVPYWDGGYMGNPVLYPLIDHSPSPDIVIVQINPVRRPGTPRTAREILNRVNEITFNASLLREIESILFIDALLDEGRLEAGSRRKVLMHLLEARDEMLPLGASSKLNTEWPFLLHLRDLGRKAASQWIETHFDDINRLSTFGSSKMMPAIDQAMFRLRSSNGHACTEPHLPASGSERGEP